MDSDVVLAFYRHPSYSQLVHPETRKVMCAHKLAALAKNAYREIREATWLLVKDRMEWGEVNFEELRTVDGIFSTPSVRGILGCLALPQGLKIRRKVPLPDYQQRIAEKNRYYRSIWPIESPDLIREIVSVEVEQEMIAFGNKIQVLDVLGELLEIPPHLTGADNLYFREMMNRSHFPIERILRFREKMREVILNPTAKRSSRTYIFMIHGSMAVWLRKYSSILFSGELPEENTRETYRDVKYQIPIDDLSYHGCILVLRYTKEGELISQKHLSIKNVMEEPDDWRKGLIFQNKRFFSSYRP